MADDRVANLDHPGAWARNTDGANENTINAGRGCNAVHAQERLLLIDGESRSAHQVEPKAQFRGIVRSSISPDLIVQTTQLGIERCFVQGCEVGLAKGRGVHWTRRSSLLADGEWIKRRKEGRVDHDSAYRHAGDRRLAKFVSQASEDRIDQIVPIGRLAACAEQRGQASRDHRIRLELWISDHIVSGFQVSQDPQGATPVDVDQAPDLSRGSGLDGNGLKRTESANQGRLSRSAGRPHRTVHEGADQSLRRIARGGRTSSMRKLWHESVT